MEKELVIQKMVHRGDGHADFCQDFLVEYESEHFFLGIVMDGCSEGNHSHFASSLFGKIFNKIVRHDKFFDHIEHDDELVLIIRSLVWQFSIDLRSTQLHLNLMPDELMSTILIGIYSKKYDDLTVAAFGDGYIRVNGQGHWIVNDKFETKVIDGRIKDGKDMPNYIIYDMDKMKYDFNEWFETIPKFFYRNVRDFSLTTDGIMTFLDKKNIKQGDVPIPFLLDDRSACGGMRNKAVLKRKMRLMASAPDPERGINGMGIRNMDDLSIIRVIVEIKQEESL